MVIAALICGIVLTGCSKVEQNEQKIASELNMNDILSFNVTTGEIVFTDSKVAEIISNLSHNSELNFFIKGKPVFEPSIPIIHITGPYCGSPLPWAMNDLVLVIFNSKDCYLFEEYLPWFFETDNENEREEILKKQEENSKKRKKELDVLISYLSDAGKIIELESESNIENGVYSGTFTVTYFVDMPESWGRGSGITTLELKNGKFTCAGNPNRFPAGGSGNYSIQDDKIIFEDLSFWTADFDWNLILKGEYDYTFDGKRLKFSAIKNNVGLYEYDLIRE